jgi:hypothetical protein
MKISNWPNSYFRAACTTFLAKCQFVWRCLIDPIAISCWINFSARCTKFLAKCKPLWRFLIDPIGIKCWINFRARCTKFLAKCKPLWRFLIDPIGIKCWINFSARCTKFLAKCKLHRLIIYQRSKLFVNQHSNIILSLEGVLMANKAKTSIF